MKKIVFIRHAKSSWAQENISDFDRPLNERGQNDAPVMAHRLLDQGIYPDFWISSSALRAKSTAQVFKDVFKDDTPIHYSDALYHASQENLLQEIRNLDQDKKCVFLFGHNPGLTDFVNALCRIHIDNIPTSGCAMVRIHVDKWEDIQLGENELIHFDFPKNTAL